MSRCRTDGLSRRSTLKRVLSWPVSTQNGPLAMNGSILGGAAGFEIDRADQQLGTPPGAVLVARAAGFSDAYQGVIEDVTTSDSRQGGSVSPLVRSDIIFMTTEGGGAVFSVGSIAWCGA